MKAHIGLCLVISVLLLVISACAPLISEGDVYAKEFRPEHTQTTLIPITISNGKSSSIMVVPYIIHYPDRWVIFIRDFDSEKNKYIEEDFFVSQAVYDQVAVGSRFVFDKDMGTREEPYTKEREKK